MAETGDAKADTGERNPRPGQNGLLERVAGEVNRKGEQVAVGTAPGRLLEEHAGGRYSRERERQRGKLKNSKRPPGLVPVRAGGSLFQRHGWSETRVAATRGRRGRRNGFLRLAAVSVDSFAPAHLALRAAFGSLPCGCPRRLGCAPCTKRSTSPIHEALSRWFCHSATKPTRMAHTSSLRNGRAVSWLIPQVDF